MAKHARKPNAVAVETPEIDELDAKLKALEKAEKAVDSAYSTGKAERAKITQMAQLDAAEAVAMAGMAMEADVDADEAMRITVIAEKSGDRARAKEARKKEREARRKAKAEHKAATHSAKKAYEAIKFSAPNKMGFMRVVQVMFAIHIMFVLVWLMLTSRDTMTYNVTTIMDWVMAILEGVAFWMFINRYKIARPLVIGMAAFGIIVPVIAGVASGQFNPFAIVFNSSFYIFLILYFSLSKRVKATLVNDFASGGGDYEKDNFVINRRGWPFVRNLIIYFILFSILGHWMEMGMCQFIRLGLVEGEYDPTNTMLWRDWLYPFPMEGAAVVVIALVLYPFFLWLKKKFPGKKRFLAYIISFIAGALLCSVIEFSMGLLVNANYELWDYRDNFGNVMGQVCLQNTLAFGAVAGIITWWVYPMLERMIARVPRDIMNIVFVVVAIFGGIIWSLYLVNLPGVDDMNLPENKDRTEVVQKEYEAKSVALRLSRVNDSLNLLEKSIDSTTELDKEKLKSDVAKIRKKMNQMLKDDLGQEAYPNAYEEIVMSAREGMERMGAEDDAGSDASASGSSAASSDAATSSASASEASSGSAASSASAS